MDSHWDGVCVAPGIWKPIKTKETPHKLWNAENSEHFVKANLNDQFLKMFQYKQSKVKSNHSFTFQKVKVIAAERNPDKPGTNLIKSTTFSVQNSRQLNFELVSAHNGNIRGRLYLKWARRNQRIFFLKGLNPISLTHTNLILRARNTKI